MHELSLVGALIEQVQGEVEQAKVSGKIHRVEISVGRLSGANADCLRFAFHLLTANTPLENAEIVIHEPQAICRCQDCNARVEIDQLVVQCPRCASSAITIEGGRELMLQSIDVEE